MAWSLLALGLAAFNYVMHRDISANIFFGSFILIQALKRPDEEMRVSQKAINLSVMLGAATLTFAIASRLIGLDWKAPSPW